MAQIDSVAAAKAGLEMMMLDNQSLLDQFGNLLQQLEQMAALPAEERHQQLRALENDGAFDFNGIDIRRFQLAPAQALPPAAFLARTRRRLDNTLTLLRELLQRKTFEEGQSLAMELGTLVSANVDAADAQAVVGFRDRVETLRNAPPFLTYLDVRKAFLQQDPEFRAEANFINTKEAVADGEEAVRARGEELEQIQSDMDAGKITPADVQAALDDLPPLE